LFLFRSFTVVEKFTITLICTAAGSGYAGNDAVDVPDAIVAEVVRTTNDDDNAEDNTH
jgi:hypothetical protein